MASDVRVPEFPDSVRLGWQGHLGVERRGALRQLLAGVISHQLDLNVGASGLRIDVELARDGWVTVTDDGAGFPLRARIARQPAFDVVFRRPFGAPRVQTRKPRVTLSLHERDAPHLSVVQALCERFEFETTHGGRLHVAAFERGLLVRPLEQQGRTARRGTRFHFRPDEALLGRAKLELRALKKWLESLRALVPGLEITLQGERLARHEGPASWLQTLVQPIEPVTLLSVSGVLHEVRVDAGLAWQPRRRRPRLFTFVNCKPTNAGGAEASGLLQALRESAPTESVAEMAQAGLVAVVHVWLADPAFIGFRGDILDSDVARVAVRELTRKALQKAPWWWDWFLERELR